MSIAYDLFAETNPAFGTFGLVGFCQKFEAASGRPPELALAYLALPLALSDDLETSFDKTVATTGLLSWLNRFPDIRLDLGARTRRLEGHRLRCGTVRTWHKGAVTSGSNLTFGARV